MATIGGDVTEQITSEVDLFGSIMQKNVIKNEFNREYALLATIQPGMAIEFTVKSANDLYLDLNNSRLHVIDQSGQTEHRREHSGSNKFDASLDISCNWAKVQRSKCRRHEPALPV